MRSIGAGRCASAVEHEAGSPEEGSGDAEPRIGLRFLIPASGDSLLPSTDVTAFVRAALPAPPARVLEVGAGDGELAAALAAAGYDVVAIDPASESPTRCKRSPCTSSTSRRFDAAVAVVSLHHVQPLDESFERLAALVRPGGVLVIDEIDFERFDERAARWWLDHTPTTRGDAGGDGRRACAGTCTRSRACARRWRRGSSSASRSAARTCYRWDMPPGMREPEEELIAAGDLPATGARLVGIRRP